MCSLRSLAQTMELFMNERYQIEGSIYYITSVIYDRIKLFISPSFIIPLIDSLGYYRYQYSVKIIGYVIMQDHIHLLLYPPMEQAITDFPENKQSI